MPKYDFNDGDDREQYRIDQAKEKQRKLGKHRPQLPSRKYDFNDDDREQYRIDQEEFNM